MPKSPQLLTTGMAAKLCSVTPDTVLKWIKAGRVPARRTAGGHYRIHRRDLALLQGPAGHEGRQASPPRRSFQFCWEFNSGSISELLVDCQRCIVYRMRAYRCYEVLNLVPDAGHAKRFCTKSCDACDYYLQVHQQRTNVLVVSNNARLVDDLRQERDKAPFNLEFTDCEYGCSALVETFRPDFVVIDCGLGRERGQDIAGHLQQDPRIPWVRVVLAAQPDGLPAGCDKEVFARIETPFTISDVAACIGGTREPTDEQ